MAERAETASRPDELLGIEGNAARLYFGAFAGMIKPDEERDAAEFGFDFEGRNRRPPRDPVNALLSLGYSLLAKDLTVACYAVGFDPFIGYYHQPRFGRPALALDLMEPFRPLIADSAVLDGGEYGDGYAEGLCACRQVGCADAGRPERFLAGIRVADGHVGDASTLRLSCELSQATGDSGAAAGAGTEWGDWGIPGIYDALGVASGGSVLKGRGSLAAVF